MNREDNLLIIGAGQYGRLAKEVAKELNIFKKISFLDDRSEVAIGKTFEYEDFVSEYAWAFVAIGDSDFRLAMIEKLQAACFKIAILISPKAYVAPSAQLSKGIIVEPMAVIQANATIAIGCLVCSGAIVKHNAFVGDGCYLDCNSVVQTGAFVPAKTKVNANMVYPIENVAAML